MKILLNALAILALVATAARAEETNLPPVKVSATLKINIVLRPDIYMDNPNGVEKKQYFKVVEQHVVTYKFKNQTLSATNEIATDRIVVKEMIRIGYEWAEKPK